MLAAVQTPVIVALITSSVSLAIAIFSAAWTARQSGKLEEQKHSLQQNLEEQKHSLQQNLEEYKHSLQQAAKIEERLSEAKAELDRYREPLLVAADDLGERIDNIRSRGFHVYLRPESPRQETALRSTLFRFAQYFGWREILHRGLSVLRFERAEDTKEVARLMSHVVRTLATDKWDRTNGYDSSLLMIWQEEQRAIGELMQEAREGGTPASVSFASFVDQFEPRYSRWFERFAAELLSTDLRKSKRLEYLHGVLAMLVIELDQDGVYIRRDHNEQIIEPEWITRAPESLDS
jgi:regulator of replication initiation timing